MNAGSRDGLLPESRESLWKSLLYAAVLTVAAAVLGSLASVSAPGFYSSLRLPSWAPPSSVFGPVWTTLYVMMGVAAWLVARSPGHSDADRLLRRRSLRLYAGQLALNAIWSWIFFRWRQGGLAAIDILLLWGVLILTIRSFWRVRRLAGALLLPYLVWVSFAAVLNVAVWRMNPESL